MTEQEMVQRVADMGHIGTIFLPHNPNRSRIDRLLLAPNGALMHIALTSAGLPRVNIFIYNDKTKCVEAWWYGTSHILGTGWIRLIPGNVDFKIETNEDTIAFLKGALADRVNAALAILSN